jgi:hypothetical protein
MVVGGGMLEVSLYEISLVFNPLSNLHVQPPPPTFTANAVRLTEG